MSYPKYFRVITFVVDLIELGVAETLRSIIIGKLEYVGTTYLRKLVLGYQTEQCNYSENLMGE
jgi:hypothetical protein